MKFLRFPALLICAFLATITAVVAAPTQLTLSGGTFVGSPSTIYMDTANKKICSDSLCKTQIYALSQIPANTTPYLGSTIKGLTLIYSDGIFSTSDSLFKTEGTSVKNLFASGQAIAITLSVDGSVFNSIQYDPAKGWLDSGGVEISKLPAWPAKTGYKFIGFSTDDANNLMVIDESGNILNVAKSLSGAVSAIAKWELNTSLITCNAGQFLANNSSFCSICPVNTWCPGGTFTQSNQVQGLNYCDSGLISLQGSSSIEDCVTAQSVTCSAGSFLSGNNSTTCAPCSANFWCPGGTFAQSFLPQGLNYCGDGMISESLSDSIEDCISNEATCAAGEFLPNDSLICETCILNHWCPGGKFTYNSQSNQGNNWCGEGLMTSNTGSTVIEDCLGTITCAGGQYLPKNSVNCQSCPENNWCPGGNYSTSSSTDQWLYGCPSGQTSASGSDSSDDCISNEVTCAAGDYLPKGTLTCKICPENNYCKGGTFPQSDTSNQGIETCPNGGTSAGGSDGVEDCTIPETATCAAGDYLPKGTLTCKICPENNYCKGGTFPQSDTSNQGIEQCPNGGTSAGGSDGTEDCTIPEATCLVGQYLPSNTLVCDTCTENYYCKGGTFSQYYKDQGIEQCPNGGLTGGAGAGDIAQCVIPCDAGTYLTKGNTGICEICPANNYCTGGNFNINMDSDFGITACNTGLISVPGSTNPDACLPVSSGISCAPGLFLPANTNKCDSCLENNWCPGGTFLQYYKPQGINKCPNGTSCGIGNDSENDCTVTQTSITCEAGEYLPANGTTCKICTVGSWCQGGTFYNSSDNQGTKACAVGTTSNEGAKFETDCYAVNPDSITCSAGDYLPENSLVCATCQAGAWCPGGTFSQSVMNQGINSCPNEGKSPLKSSSITKCYKNGLELSVPYGTGTQTCYWGTVGYTDGCGTEWKVTSCAGGYYWAGYNPSCDEVGKRYFSKDGQIDRKQCPALTNMPEYTGKTETTTSSSINDCYVEVPYVSGSEPKNGIGMMDCKYNDSTSNNYGLAENFDPANNILPPQPSSGDNQCTDSGIMFCIGGYYLNKSCIPLENGYFSYRPSIDEFMSKGCLLDPNICATEYGFDLTKPETMTNKADCPKSFPNSDSGRNEATDCYNICDATTIIIEHSTEVTAVNTKIYTNTKDTVCKYNITCESGYTATDNGTASPSCVKSQSIVCSAGTYLPANASVCETCVATNYCEGGSFIPSANNQGITACPGDGTTLARASSVSKCYKSCSSVGMDIPYSESITAVADKVYWTDGAYPDCEFTVTCQDGFHLTEENSIQYCIKDGTTCINPNALVCDANGIPTQCKNGYHVEKNTCLSNTQSCTIENGTGEKEWVSDSIIGGRWTNCTAVACNHGYTYDRSLTDETTKQCGVCRNMYDANGKKAVSSWGNNCQIAACLYQGELYALTNNECVQVCDTDGREDETGTMYWNGTSGKCERVCNPGYVSW